MTHEALGAMVHRYARVREFLRLPRPEGLRLTLKRVRNLYRMRYEFGRGRTRLESYPIKLTVEATNVCNLRCPACFTGTGEVGRVRSMMTLELYRSLLAELGDYLFELEFYNWGEPLLSKFIYTMVAEAHGRGVSTRISTNFSIPFDTESAERLVASGLSTLGVSIDGARQETYEQYRVRGDLVTVLENCRLVRDAKKRLRATTPRMIWEFHVFPHNTGDVESARDLARELEMDMVIEKGWVAGPEWDPEGKWQFYSNPVAGRCTFLWQQAVVNNDGGVAACCGAFYQEDDMGRIGVRPAEVGAHGFREVWNGPKFVEARRLFQARSGSAETRKSICFDCPQTVMWDDWKKHLAAGGTSESFNPGYSTNDCFNYFFDRRPQHRAGAEGSEEAPRSQSRRGSTAA